MSNFSLGTFANSTGVASDKRLRAYTITEVKFVEAKSDVIHSEKTGQDYKVLKVRFANEELGYYEESLFLPSTTGQDVERQPNSWGGESPSAADRALMFIAHVLSVLNHDGFEKLKKLVGKMSTFEQIAAAAAKLLNEKKNTKCYLKLTGRVKDGYLNACLPYYTSINKDTHEAYVSNNFLSLKDDLAFTPSEDKKRQEAANIKPTNMKSDPALDAVSAAAESTAVVDNSDIDAATQDELDGMLNDL